MSETYGSPEKVREIQALCNTFCQSLLPSNKYTLLLMSDLAATMSDTFIQSNEAMISGVREALGAEASEYDIPTIDTLNDKVKETLQAAIAQRQTDLISAAARIAHYSAVGQGEQANTLEVWVEKSEVFNV